MAEQRETAVLDLMINANAAGASLKEINQQVKFLTKEVTNMHRADNPALYRSRVSQLNALIAAQSAMRQEIRGTTRDLNQQSTSWKDVAKGILASGAIQQGLGMIKSFGQEVVRQYTEMEKYNAVLTNALGDAGTARQALNNLQKFATETPFQLNEVTESYVKFVNRGIVPSMDQMRKYGDLAASQGKSFDQLTEAILDATTGEFERLKEFGIRANKTGDTVSLSFKGITQEVKNTDEAIQAAIEKFGEMDGVMGGMEKTSQTLGGQIFNLDDTWDQLLVTIGGKTSGAIYNAVQLISNYLTWLNEAMKSSEQRVQESADAMAQRDLKEYNSRSKSDQASMYAGTKSGIDYYKRGRERALASGDQAGADDFNLDLKRAQSFVDAVDAQKKHQEEEEKKRKERDRQDALKQAKKDAEKQAKEHEKAAKKAAAELQQLLKQYQTLRDESQRATLSDLDQQLFDLDKKYDTIIAKLRKAGKTTEADNLVAGKKMFRDQVFAADRQQQGEARVQARDDQQKWLEDLLDTSLQNQKGEAATGFAQAMDGASTEQQRLDLKAQYDLKEQDMELAHLEALKALREQYGDSTTDLDEQIAMKRISIRQAELDTKATLEEREKQQQLARYEFAREIASGLASLVDFVLGKSKAAIAIQKAIAVGQIAIDTAQSISATIKAASKTSLTPIDRALQIAIGIGQVLGAMAKAKAVLAAADSAQSATGVNEPDQQRQGRQYARGGILPQGPSHSGGGINLVDPYGMALGQIEGGEPILSRATYAANPEIVNQLLNSGGQRVDTGRIIQAISARQQAFAGNQSSTQGPAAASAVTDNTRLEALISVLIAKTENAGAKQVVFPWNVFEEKQAEIMRIRNEVNA